MYIERGSDCLIITIHASCHFPTLVQTRSGSKGQVSFLSNKIAPLVRYIITLCIAIKA